MNPLYVQDATDYREATSDEVMRYAHALIAQQFRRGAPVLGSPA